MQEELAGTTLTEDLRLCREMKWNDTAIVCHLQSTQPHEAHHTHGNSSASLSVRVAQWTDGDTQHTCLETMKTMYVKGTKFDI